MIFVYSLIHWLWLILLSDAEGTVIDVNTTGEQSYTRLSSVGFELGRSNCVILHVRSCHTARVLLEDDHGAGRGYRIVLNEGTSADKNVIREHVHSDGFMKVAEHIQENIVNCSGFKRIRYGWGNGVLSVSVWIGGEWKGILIWADSTPRVIKDIGVGTLNTDGTWRIQNQECHYSTSTTPLWQEAETKKDIGFASAKFILLDSKTVLQCIYQCHVIMNCLYVTYNEKTRLCRGSTEIESTSDAIGNSLWIRT